MVNMSYCRFENTFKDLRDCEESINNGDKLSRSEYDYRAKLLRLCADLLENCNCVIEMPDGGLENQFPPFDQQQEY